MVARSTIFFRREKKYGLSTPKALHKTAWGQRHSRATSGYVGSTTTLKGLQHYGVTIVEPFQGSIICDTDLGWRGCAADPGFVVKRLRRRRNRGDNRFLVFSEP